MKKTILALVLMISLVGCRDEEMKKIASVRQLERSSYEKKLRDMRKHLTDSLGKAFKHIKDAGGWYSATEMKLPVGFVVGFKPDSDIKSYTGPYFVIVKSPDGKQSITQVAHKTWWVLKEGDVIK